MKRRGKPEGGKEEKRDSKKRRKSLENKPKGGEKIIKDKNIINKIIVMKYNKKNIKENT